MMEYDANQIARHSWPPVQATADGRWRRELAILLKESVAVPQAIEELTPLVVEDFLDYLKQIGIADLAEELEVTIHWSGQRELTLSVITRTEQSSRWYEVMIATWRLFETVDRVIGTIDMIEGEPRDNWPPFSLRKYRTDGG